jgi:hypothetical protein
VKLYDGHGGRFRSMFRLRDPINHGILAGSGASTGFLPNHQPTGRKHKFSSESTLLYRPHLPSSPVPTPTTKPRPISSVKRESLDSHTGPLNLAIAHFLIYIRPVQIFFSKCLDTPGQSMLSTYVFESWDALTHLTGSYLWTQIHGMV